MQLLEQAIFGNDLPAVKASIKKHEAIESEIIAYKERVMAVESLAIKIEEERFHDIEKVQARKDRVMELWSSLLVRLGIRSSRLKKHLELHKIFQEIINIIDWMEDVKVSWALLGQKTFNSLQTDTSIKWTPFESGISC